MPFEGDDAKKVFIALFGALTGAAILQNHHDEHEVYRSYWLAAKDCLVRFTRESARFALYFCPG
jgi:hypothetical protein